MAFREGEKKVDLRVALSKNLLGIGMQIKTYGGHLSTEIAPNRIVASEEKIGKYGILGARSKKKQIEFDTHRDIDVISNIIYMLAKR